MHRSRSDEQHSKEPCLVDVPNPLGAAPVYYTPMVGSTMDFAASMVRQYGGAGGRGGTTGVSTDGLVVCAGVQTAGRGTHGRVWSASEGSALLLTVVLSQSRTDPLVSLRFGLAVRDFALRYGARPEIKWPNDVLYNGRKLAGVLSEARRGLTFIGVGINLRGAPVELNAVSLCDAGCRNCSDFPAPLEVLPEFLRCCSARIAAGPESIVSDLRSCLYGRRARLRYTAPDGTTTDVEVETVQRDGGLVMARDGYRRTVYAGRLTNVRIS